MTLFTHIKGNDKPRYIYDANSTTRSSHSCHQWFPPEWITWIKQRPYSYIGWLTDSARLDATWISWEYSYLTPALIWGISFLLTSSRKRGGRINRIRGNLSVYWMASLTLSAPLRRGCRKEDMMSRNVSGRNEAVKSWGCTAFVSNSFKFRYVWHNIHAHNVIDRAKSALKNIWHVFMYHVSNLNIL